VLRYQAEVLIPADLVLSRRNERRYAPFMAYAVRYAPLRCTERVNRLRRAYEAGGRQAGQHEIEYLWSKLDRLDPEDWPTGVDATRREHDLGTAGFPDGAGLYRRTGEPLPPFPVGGVMFVGHNTDAAARQSINRPQGRSPGEPGFKPRMKTWSGLYDLFEQADFDPREMFFTNIYVGLKPGKISRGEFAGRRDPLFKAWCSAFLDEQIQLMRPRAVITLGAPAAKAFGWPPGPLGTKERAGLEFKAAALLHPSADYYLRQVRRDTREVERDYQARILREVAGS
jgi:hypothetical protein